MASQIVRDAMTPNPRTIGMSTTLQEAAQLMRDEDTGVLPIVDGDRLAGVVTDRDIVVRALAEGRDVTSTVGELASGQLITIDPDQSLEEAGRLMAEHQVRRLPVTEEDGRLVGILSQGDLAIAAGDAETGRVVEDISR